MKISFQRRFAAVVALAALIQFSLMSGPPGAMGFGGPLTATSGQQSGSQPGVVSNSTAIPARHQLMPLPNVPGGSYYVYSQIETKGSLAAYTPPVSGMYMSMVHVQGGISGGGIAVVYATPNTAVFGVGASTSGGVVGVYGCGVWQSYPVSWILNGTNIPSGTFADKGDYFQAILTCQTSPPAGNPDISAYRAIATVSSPTTVTTTALTVTFDAQPGVIRGIMAWGVNDAGNATVGDNSAYISYSAGGAYVQYVPVQSGLGPAYVFAMQPIPAANTAAISLVTVTLTGTTTFRAFILSFY